MGGGERLSADRETAPGEDMDVGKAVGSMLFPHLVDLYRAIVFFFALLCSRS